MVLRFTVKPTMFDQLLAKELLPPYRPMIKYGRRLAGRAEAPGEQVPVPPDRVMVHRVVHPVRTVTDPDGVPGTPLMRGATAAENTATCSSPYVTTEPDTESVVLVGHVL